MLKRSPRLVVWLGLALLALALGCGDSIGAGMSKVKVSLTDAPDPMLESAIVEVGQVQLVPSTGSAVTLTESAGIYNLLSLQNGATRTLTELEVPPGRYLQLRMIIKSATVTLKPTHAFTDGTRSKSLILPSGAQSGLKINLTGGVDGQAGVELAQGIPSSLVVDFDVSQSFVVQGSAGAINGYLFKPALRAVDAEAAGTIEGKVLGSAVAGRLIHATQVGDPDTEEFETRVVTGMTDNDGKYVLRFVAPGSYNVTLDGAVTIPDLRLTTVAKGEVVTGINFTLQ